jgi:hypothetical protein
MTAITVGAEFAAGVALLALGLYAGFTGNSPLGKPKAKGSRLTAAEWRKYGRVCGLIGGGVVLLGVGVLVSGWIGLAIAIAGFACTIVALVVGLRFAARVRPDGRPLVTRGRVVLIMAVGSLALAGVVAAVALAVASRISR